VNPVLLFAIDGLVILGLALLQVLLFEDEEMKNASHFKIVVLPNLFL
jgi:hypothetical protein